MSFAYLLILAVLVYIAYQLYRANRTKGADLELKCRSTGLELHNRLTSVDWRDLGGPKGEKPRFYKPYTKYDKAKNCCLLLTGFSFDDEDERGYEQREVVRVFDVTTGKMEEELLFGWGHIPGALKGKKDKDTATIEADNESMGRHKQLLKEFGA